MAHDLRYVRVEQIVPPSPTIGETPWTGLVIGWAMMFGWQVNHQRPARRKDGSWRTATEGHVGFPDLTLAHPRHGVVFSELKSHRGKLSADQETWRDTILAGGGVWYLWKPADFDEVMAVLTEGPSRVPS